jgi:hypothetical protein
MEDVLVVGAGFAGLAAALALARRGARVRVIERAKAPGGLAASAEFRGIPCDLGSHRVHPDALAQPLLAELHAAEPLLCRPRRGVLLFAGQRVPYPPSLLELAAALGPRRAVTLAASALRQGLRGEEPAVLDADEGFEDFVTARVGRGPFEVFHAPYVRKVFGLEPHELSALVAKKRVSSRSPWSTLRGPGAGGAPAVSGTFYYPRGGIGSLVQKLLERLRALGVSVTCSRPFLPEDLRGPPVVYTGELADLVATPLRHRGLYLVFLALPGERLGLAETYYAPEPSYWFGRVSELANYSPALARPGESLLCVEIPEGAWGEGVDFTAPTRLPVLLGQLERAGILRPGARPLAVRQHFVPQVYPLYRRGFFPEWRATLARVAALGHVFPVGRQALFLHTNLDHAADMAWDAAEHLARGGDAASWIDGAARYLRLVVRD